MMINLMDIFSKENTIWVPLQSRNKIHEGYMKEIAVCFNSKQYFICFPEILTLVPILKQAHLF